MSDSKLITKYRPKKLAEVVGQDHIIKPLQSIIKARSSQAFLLTGPSGCGKTTIARIGAGLMGAHGPNVIDFNAAKNTGVDDVRALEQLAQYAPLDGGHRAIVVDECHRLSTQAWDALLKILEEPPAHISWWLCTTEPGKVKPTIKTRCTAFALRDVSETALDTLLDDVCTREKIDIADDVAMLVIREAKGSPRQMLANLAMVRECETLKDAKAALSAAINKAEIVELCRFILTHGSWAKAMAIVSRLQEGGENPESCRIVMCNYIGKALQGAKSDKDALAKLSILEAFSATYNSSEGWAPLLLSIGRALYAE